MGPRLKLPGYSPSRKLARWALFIHNELRAVLMPACLAPPIHTVWAEL